MIPIPRILGLSQGKIKKVKQNNYSHRTHVSLLFSGPEVCWQPICLSLASFSWVWWLYGVTPMTFTTVRMVRTAGYGPFNTGSKLWVGILFTYRRSSGRNLWASSDMGQGVPSQTVWWVVLWACCRACRDLRMEWFINSALGTSLSLGKRGNAFQA